MTQQAQPSQADIARMTTLLIHGHLADIYALQKVNMDVGNLPKLGLRDILLVIQIGLEPGITSSKLSHLFRMSSPLLSTRITALMKLNLVQQVEDTKDRRVHNLKLLASGKKVYQFWYKRIEALAINILMTHSLEDMNQMEERIEYILKSVQSSLIN